MEWVLLFTAADGPNNRIQKIVDSGLCHKLCHFLMLSTEKDIVSPALRAVGNILTGDDLQTQVNLNVIVKGFCSNTH